jgi:hypothetical protein
VFDRVRAIAVERLRGAELPQSRTLVRRAVDVALNGARHCVYVDELARLPEGDARALRQLNRALFSRAEFNRTVGSILRQLKEEHSRAHPQS